MKIKKGVYTATCAKCRNLNYVHVDGEGGFDPVRCRSCKTSFLGIEKGERNNEYIAQVSEKDLDASEEGSKNKKNPIKIRKKEFNNESFKLRVKTEE